MLIKTAMCAKKVNDRNKSYDIIVILISAKILAKSLNLRFK